MILISLQDESVTVLNNKLVAYHEGKSMKLGSNQLRLNGRGLVGFALQNFTEGVCNKHNAPYQTSAGGPAWGGGWGR